MKIDLKKLQPFIEEKYITVRKHPTADLWIYDYTAKAQYEKKWTPETMMCRGLILDKKGNIVARPFPKFFNLEEHKGAFPEGKPECFEKLDGSLGIMYWIDDTPYISTRGSFESEQAKKGTEILHKKYPGIKALSSAKNITLLFEIIYPGNRIVVDYGKTEDLFLLDIIDNSTGQSILDIDNLTKDYIPIVKRYHNVDFKNPPKLAENKEGFVFKWPDGYRLKFKFEEYVRLHKLITGVNAKRIWEIMSNNQSLEELLDRVPDEFYKWVKDIIAQLDKKFFDIRIKASNAVAEHGYKNMERKEAANHIMRNYPDVSAVIFKMMDDKDPTALIWKMIKPKHEVPFKIDFEG